MEHCGLNKFDGGCELNSVGLGQELVVGLCSMILNKIAILSLISQQIFKTDLPHSHIYLST